MSTFPLLQGTYPAGDIYGHSLASAFFNEFRILEPDFAQEREPAVWELIMRDPTVAQAILQRIAVVAPKTWQVEPASDDPKDVKLASIVEEMLRGIVNFTQARSDLAKAIFRGRAYAFICGSRRRHAWKSGTRVQNWWTPKHLQSVDKRRVMYASRRDPKTRAVKKYTQLFSVERTKWETIPDFQDLFVSVKYGGDEEHKLGYGRGLIETLYFLWYARMKVMKEGLQAVERWSQGFLLGKVDSSVRPGEAGKNPDDAKAAMLTMLTKHRALNAAVVDAADDIELVTGPTGEHSLAEFWINYIDAKILAVSLGATLPFGGASDVGSLARSITEQNVADDRTELDRSVVDEAIGRSLIGAFLRNNQAQLAEEGLSDAGTPTFETISQRKEDPKENAEQAEIILRSGAPLRRKEYYARVGWEMPDSEDADLIRPQATDLMGSSLGPSFPGEGSSPPSDSSEPDAQENVEDLGDAGESELLGKVGGITGAIEILKALDEATITRTTAVRLFVLFFHLTPQEASRLVGASGQENKAADVRQQDQGAGAVAGQRDAPDGVAG